MLRRVKTGSGRSDRWHSRKTDPNGKCPGPGWPSLLRSVLCFDAPLFLEFHWWLRILMLSGWLFLTSFGENWIETDSTVLHVGNDPLNGNLRKMTQSQCLHIIFPTKPETCQVFVAKQPAAYFAQISGCSKQGQRLILDYLGNVTPHLSRAIFHPLQPLKRPLLLKCCLFEHKNCTLEVRVV